MRWRWELRRRFAMFGPTAGDGGALTLWTYRHLLLDGRVAEEELQLSALRCCSSISEVRSMHSHIWESGLESSSPAARNTLLNMYAKLGSTKDATMLFDANNVVAWTCIISKAVTMSAALTFFRQMLLAGVVPDRVAFVCMFNKFHKLDHLVEGRRIHDFVREAHESPERDTLLQTSIVNMYNRCGSMDDARREFWGMHRKDVISWNVFIGSYIQRGLWQDALDAFQKMVSEGVILSHVTVLHVCKACGNLKDLAGGRLLHSQVVANSALEHLPQVGNALLDMYGKCGSLEDAKYLFDMMPVKTEVSWNILIATFSQKGRDNVNVADQQELRNAQRRNLREAVKLFRRMQMEGFSASEFTLVSVADATSALGSLPLGKFVHGCILDGGYQNDVTICNSLMVMYADCGSVATSRNIFERMHHRDLISWNSMLSAYARHGHFEESLELFLEMQLDGENKPDHVTFVSVFFACGHAGLIADGCMYFGCMKTDFGVEALEEHVSCIVDMLGRMGWIDLAEGFLQKTLPSSKYCWKTLLGACHSQGDVEQGKWILKRTPKDHSIDAASYVTIYNICSA